MVANDDPLLTSRHYCRRKLLTVLRWHTTQGQALTASEAARAIDIRASVPRTTIAARRGMLNEMREQGLVELVARQGSRHKGLRITAKGAFTLRRLGEVQ